MRGIYQNVLHAIGDTPLVQLNKIVGRHDARVLAKLEFMNPGGSVKDRMALHIIEEAERSGALKPGAVIVENTSGNTGVGVAVAAAVKGYRCIFTMPDKMSLEKVRRLRAFGAEVVVTPTAVPAEHPDSYYETAKRIFRETPNAFMLNQYHNKLNIEAHALSTGPEIWEQTGGNFDVFVAGLGTGGTLMGSARRLREHNPDVQIVACEPKQGDPVSGLRSLEDGFVPPIFDIQQLDRKLLVDNRASIVMTRRLAAEEGIFAGVSSGAVIHVCAQIAARMDRGTIVGIVCDSGWKYLSAGVWTGELDAVEDAVDNGIFW